jgi:hypothetical protein
MDTVGRQGSSSCMAHSSRSMGTSTGLSMRPARSRLTRQGLLLQGILQMPFLVTERTIDHEHL